MKRHSLLPLVFTFYLCASGQETDWMNFATGLDGIVVNSIAFKNNGKLKFEENSIIYEDALDIISIPYFGGAYIYFSEKPSGVGAIVNDNELSLIYCSESCQIKVMGCDFAQQIRIMSLQGVVLHSANNVNTINTSNLPKGFIIATAICNGKSVTNKFIIH